MTNAVSTGNVSSFAAELADLLVENEAQESDTDRLQRDAARSSFIADAQHQVDALRNAASATAAGAYVSAAMTIAGGSFKIGGAGNCQIIGTSLNSLAEPANAIVGDSTAKRLAADAKVDETLGEQAKWQMGDATSALDKVDQLSDKLLGLIEGLQHDQSSANNAVIGRI